MKNHQLRMENLVCFPYLTHDRYTDRPNPPPVPVSASIHTQFKIPNSMNPNESNPSIKYAKVASGEGISYPQELTPYIQKSREGIHINIRGSWGVSTRDRFVPPKTRLYLPLPLFLLGYSNTPSRLPNPNIRNGPKLSVKSLNVLLAESLRWP